MTNILIKIATEAGRDYITPEDVSEAFRRGAEPEAVRRDLCEVVGNQTGFGCEDYSLCAFIAFRGTA